MGISAPWAESLDIIALQPIKILRWVNPMGLSVPMDEFLDVIDFQKAKIN